MILAGPGATQAATGAGVGQAFAFAGVYDGHGGSAVAEWLTNKFKAVVEQYWSARNPEAALTEAYLQADKQLLSATNGFLGLGERGVGGSKCGATAVNVWLYDTPQGTQLVRAVRAMTGWGWVGAMTGWSTPHTGAPPRCKQAGTGRDGTGRNGGVNGRARVPVDPAQPPRMRRRARSLHTACRPPPMSATPASC